MKGKSVVEATLDGAGPVVATPPAALHELEHALADPARARRARRAGRALRRGAGALRRARRLRARGARPRGAGRPRLRAGGDGRRRRRALGRLEDARRPGAHPGDAARRAAARRADQPPRPRVHPLARGLARRLPGRAADDLARPRVPEPHGRRRSSRSTAGELHQLLRRLRLLRAPARDRRARAGRAVRAPAGDARQGGGLHRALQGARQPRRAGAVARQEAREDREGRAAEAAPDGRLRVPPGPALGRRRGAHRGPAQGLRRARRLRRPRSLGAPPRALVRDGRERRRQVDPAQAGGRRGRRPTPAA